MLNIGQNLKCTSAQSQRKNTQVNVLMYILQTQLMQNMDALCEFGAYKSEGKQVKPRDFLWSIMFSGILISVRNHPYSSSAKWCVGGDGQMLMRAKSIKGKKDIYFKCFNSVITMRRNLPKTFSVLKFWINLLNFSLKNFW